MASSGPSIICTHNDTANRQPLLLHSRVDRRRVLQLALDFSIPLAHKDSEAGHTLQVSDAKLVDGNMLVVAKRERVLPSDNVAMESVLGRR